MIRPPWSAVVLAASSDLNDELTVIVSVLGIMLRQDEIERVDLLDAQSAAQRAIWKVDGLLKWSGRNGAKASAATMERLLEQA